jgi:hypothetical protein
MLVVQLPLVLAMLLSVTVSKSPLPPVTANLPSVTPQLATGSPDVLTKLFVLPLVFLIVPAAQGLPLTALAISVF